MCKGIVVATTQRRLQEYNTITFHCSSIKNWKKETERENYASSAKCLSLKAEKNQG
jgi:hypothetical protein